MEFRKIFDTIPEKFDKWRPKYCNEVFECIFKETSLNKNKSVLEIGPGTGIATEPILKTGCDYLGVELGEHLYEFTKKKLASYKNFHIVNGDFENYDFGDKKFDLVFSAAAIQWIPEEIAFTRSFNLLKSGGYLAMMMLHGDNKTPNPDLYNEIEEYYAKYFHPETPYPCKMIYSNAVNYGFTDFRKFEFHSNRTYNADDYIEYIGTHCDHINIPESDKTKMFEGIRSTIKKHGDIIKFDDTVVLYLAKKP